jgi:flagellar hook-associated protein 1 FlgK
MSLAAILNSANTGLLTAQVGLRTVSDNIANANTPGYVRKVVSQTALAADGMGVGVDVAAVRRVTDSYLQSASLNAGASAGRAGVVAEFLGTAQGLFGDPSSDTSFFSGYDAVLAAFSALADNPASSLARSQALTSVRSFLSDANRITASLSDLGKQADTRINADVDRVNTLLKQIDDLNADIIRAKSVNSDATGSENIQNNLINELSGLINVSVGQRPGGGIILRATDGTVLAGQGGAAVLTYQRSDTAQGYLTVTPPGGALQPQPAKLLSGEIQGLLDLRNNQLPGISDQLGEFVTRAVQELNRAHNASTAVPAPQTLTGSNTGLDIGSAIGGFSGTTNIAVVDAAGVIQHQVAIDFTAGTMSLDGGGAVGFSPATFDADLGGLLAGFASVSFTNGTLSISATTAGQGVAIQDDATSPSMKAGRGFSQFFGLNDLIRSSGFTSYDTGLQLADAHGFTPGGQVRFRIEDASGQRLRDVTATIPVAADMASLVAALNDPVSGVGLYGQFSLDANGALTYAGLNANGATVSVISDTTQRGPGGPSLTELFGIGPAERSTRASRYSIDPGVLQNPQRLALARINLAAAPGTAALAPGDGRGAVALAASGDGPTGFSAAGGFSAVTMSLTRYASEFGGDIGRRAAAADTAKTAADAVQAEADQRRAAVEGVNIDEELVNMTTYQQAFNASARVIQAAKDMYDVLIAMMN